MVSRLYGKHRPIILAENSTAHVNPDVEPEKVSVGTDGVGATGKYKPVLRLLSARIGGRAHNHSALGDFDLQPTQGQTDYLL